MPTPSAMAAQGNERYLNTSPPARYDRPAPRARRTMDRTVPARQTARPPWTPPAGRGSADFSLGARGLAVKSCSAPAAPHQTCLPGAAIFIHGRRAMYQSDITQFLNQLKQQKPTLEDEQRRGRALLWDKQPIDLDERASNQAARVKQTSYVYYQNF
jgi:hypothetical protein